jgi:methionyl-tRNA synthetase
MRVGKVLGVEEHPNASKLFVLRVDFGNEERTIVAGLRNHYKKEELEGKKAVFVVNLEPVTLRGVKSDGMILAAVNSDESRIVFLEPEKDIEEGSKIR